MLTDIDFYAFGNALFLIQNSKKNKFNYLYKLCLIWH
jgi:hypothetical protein